MNHLGPYLLDRLRAKEDNLEIWEAQDAVTGTPVLIYRPLSGAPPSWSLQGVLPWLPCEHDAWVAELPFGALTIADRPGVATPGELTAWSRRLLATLLEMRALDLQHGRIGPERIWVKGDAVWLEGLGLPVAPRVPDEAAVVEALRVAAGDTWEGWPFHTVLERLAEGRLSLREAAERLAESPPLDEPELEDELLENGPVAPPAPEEPEAEEPPAPTGEDLLEDSGTVRVLGRRPASPPGEPATAPEEGSASPPPQETEQTDKAPESADPATLQETEAEETAAEPTPPPPAEPEPAAENTQPQPVELFPPEGEAAEEPPGDGEPLEEPAREESDRPVVRIDEVAEPSFEVIEPGGGPAGRANPLRWAGLLATALALALLLWLYLRPAGNVVERDEGYMVDFVVEPQGGKAELVLIDAPEGSQLAEGRVLAVIPGKVYFVVPGVYRIQIRAEGYLPQEKLLDVPPNTRSVTVRLGP